MKRELLYCLTASLVPLAFCALTALAQSGSGDLPGAKPASTPKGLTKGAPKVPPAPIAPVAPVTPTLAFNQEAKGKLDPRASAKAANGTLMEEYILNAKGDDWLTFSLKTADPNLAIQIVDKDNAEIAVARDPAVGGFKVKSETGALPAEGEYRLRVVGANSKTPILYTLRVNRLGLTGNIYNDRFNKIYFGIRENDLATIDAAITKLEELAKDDGFRPMTFEQLGILYLFNRHDVEKAEQAMTQAIKLNGAAIARITFDSQWRQIGKLKSGKLDWPEGRLGWLRIRPGQLTLADLSNKSLASLKAEQIKGLEVITIDNFYLVAMTAENEPKPFIFASGSKEKAEADLIIKLIQTYVMNK